jgi:hypothetical protein
MLNLINALANLSPSRNILSQLILLLPKDFAIIEHSYPETSSSEAKELLDILGVQFSDCVKRTKDGFAEFLYKFIHKLFDWLDDEFTYRELTTKYGFEVEKKMDVRSSLSKLTGIHINSIPNPYAEWTKLVLKKLSSRPNGSKILKFLETLLECDSLIVYDSRKPRRASQWNLFKDKIRKKLKVNPAELENLARLTVSVPGACEHL